MEKAKKVTKAWGKQGLAQKNLRKTMEKARKTWGKTSKHPKKTLGKLQKKLRDP